MDKLRWILGTIAALLALGYLGFFLWADSFRRSFGASPNAPVKLVAPLAIMVLVSLATLLPPHRLLLHLTAVAIVLTAAGCLWIVRAAPVLSLLGLCYCAGWIAYYWSVVRSA